jgi:hypothetical protein
MRFRGACLLAGLMAAFVAAVPPVGEFPCSDDWDYKATVDELVQHGLLRLSDYPAMTLVGHVGWGAAFVAAFGSSYFVLRIATLTAVALGALAMFSLAIRRGASERQACFVAFAWFASPLTVASSYTFLTDASAVGFMLIWIWLASVVLDRVSIAAWFALGLFGGCVYLFRQPAAVPVVVFGLLAGFEVIRGRMRWPTVAAFIVGLAAAVIAHQVWLRGWQGPPMNSLKPLLACDRGVVRSFDHCCSFLGALSLFSLPVTLASLGRPIQRWSIGIAAAVLLVFLVRPGPFVSFDGETLENMTLGYDRTMPGRHLLVGPTVLVGSRNVAVVDAVKFVLLLVALPSLVFAAARWRATVPPSGSASSPPPPQGGKIFLDRVLLGSLAVHAALLALAPDTFDRYLLPVLPLMFLLAAPGVRIRVPGTAALVLASVVSAVGIQDYLVRNSAFWKTIAELRQEGVPAEDILAGHAFTGIHRFTPIYRPNPQLDRRPVRASYRSVYQQRLAPVDPRHPPKYVVSFAPLEGFNVRSRTPYAGWLRRGEIVVLERIK